ncbi:MAG TPA: diguanylate cyclase [Xanthomonadaceae bacterium]|jgi:diguanylate cyclase (GGDEF)-like protein|nr:diguanylate cyclase [Xanthomonadaceae bacterium]
MLEFSSAWIARIQGSPRLRGVLVVLGCLLLFVVLPAQGLPLRGSWHAAGPTDNANAVRVAAPGSSDVRFDPVRLNAIPAGEHGAWVLLQPANEASGKHLAPAWPAGDWILQVRDPGLQSISLFPAQGRPVLNASVLQPRDRWQGHGRIGFLVDRSMLGDAPLLLRVEPGRVVAAPMRFSLVSPEEFSREDSRWLAIATACFAIMAAMAMMALLFAIELRDLTFVYYAGYVLAYALILAIQTGYVAAPLEWTWMAHAPNAWGRVATAMSVLFATLFVSRFAELAHYSPRMRIAVLALGFTTAIVMSLGSLPVPGLVLASSLLINPLLILGGPLLLAASLLARWRGSRYAGFFLLGWTPLLVITVLSSAQVFGVLGTWMWLGDAGLVAGAFEALVLSLGLADRALALRHDRDIAQALADTDGLTAVFNRRGLDRRVADLVERAQRQRRPLTLLFLDLDRFKLLNDVHGHAAGDAALIAVARLMRSDMGVQDLLGRYGGEEFLAALPERDLDSALSIARRICADLQEMKMPLASPDDVLTASIGIAQLQRGENAQALIGRADRAMYVAKGLGGNRASTDALAKDGAEA